MTLASTILEAVAKIRAIEASDGTVCADCECVPMGDVNRIADDLEYAATHAACESCATYRTVLDLCVAALPQPARYGELPGWIEQLAAVRVAALHLRKVERARADADPRFAAVYDLGSLWRAQDALDVALAKVGER